MFVYQDTGGSPVQPKSVAELMVKVSCPPPTREREDDQIVELFLNAYRQGTFSTQLDWLPQNRRNVEVISSDKEGRSLAIEHTRIYAFEDHKRIEEQFRPIAELLEAQHEAYPKDRWYHIRLKPDFLDGLSRSQGKSFGTDLAQWAKETLPKLQIRKELYSFEFLRPDKNQITIEVEVSEQIRGLRGIAVGGYLPSDPDRLSHVVRKALEDKVQKLAEANASERILLLEYPMISDSWNEVIEFVQRIAAEFPRFEMINYVVVAQTYALQSEKILWFYVWDCVQKDWSDYLRVEIQSPAPYAIPEQKP